MKMSNAESPRVMMTSITTFKTTRQVTPWAKKHLSGGDIFTIDTCLHAYSCSISSKCVYQYGGECTELRLDTYKYDKQGSFDITACIASKGVFSFILIEP